MVNMKRFNSASITIIGFILLVASLRILRVFPPNFAPVTALCLMGSAYFTRRWMAFIIPTSILFISDIILGGGTELVGVYISYAIIIFLGFVLNNNVKPVKVVAITLLSSLLFYIITNFVCWFGSPYKTQDLTGFIINYTEALPFFRTSLVSDLFFSGAFFAGFEMLRIKFPTFAKAQ